MKNKIEKKCYCTTHKIKHIDYRDVHLLGLFVDSHGKILPRKRSGLSAQFQRKVESAIKRARFMALMPYIQQ